MTLEYDIILARPGHNEKYNTDVSWDELRKTFMLYKRIPMIVAGGSHSGPIDPNEAVGFVDAKIDDKEQIIRGNAIFYKECIEDVPAEIQSRLINKHHVPASLGYEAFDSMRKVDHLAIGVKSPVFEDIGFHAEDKFRYEETEGINKPEEEPEAPEPIVQQKEEPKPMEATGFNETQLGQIREIFTSLLPVPEKVEETPPEPVEATPPEPRLEPEVQVPAQVEDKEVGGELNTVGIKTLGDSKE